jgi:hypothetical protein
VEAGWGVSAREEREGEEIGGGKKRKGHQGFKVACPREKLWGLGTSI